jgi:EAL domain-containing protein (putative c-di-GMP-specific phosphodiesterase class I)
VVAEGVETQEQFTFLRNEACDQMQGYLLGHPGPIEQYAEMIGRGTKKATAVG